MIMSLTDRIKSQKEIYDSFPVKYSTPTLSPDHCVVVEVLTWFSNGVKLKTSLEAV